MVGCVLDDPLSNNYLDQSPPPAGSFVLYSLKEVIEMENDEIYLPQKPGRWAISCLIEGRWVHLVQDSRLDNSGDAEVVLRALAIVPTKANLDRYFPYRARKDRCPTLELLELCNVLDPTNPVIKKTKQVGV